MNRTDWTQRLHVRGTIVLKGPKRAWKSIENGPSNAHGQTNNLSQSLVYATETRHPSGAAPSSRASHKMKALQALRPNALYNLGRLISYTAIGGLLGLLGSAFALSAQARAVIGVAAGAFMVAMGLTLMGILRPGVLSKLLPKKVVRKVASATATLRQRGPFLLGLVNGLMPCGPLQAMQVYAVATGSVAVGALSLFAFCLGTVPLMFVADSVITALKARWRRGNACRVWPGSCGQWCDPVGN